MVNNNAFQNMILEYYFQKNVNGIYLKEKKEKSGFWEQLSKGRTECTKLNRLL